MSYKDPKYPLFVDVESVCTVVIGAGAVAERKIKTLLSYGATVRVIALEVTPPIQELAAHGEIDLLVRGYEEGDLQEAFLVICATNDSQVNKQVYHEACKHKRLVNVVDVPELCNFYVPSIVKRGPLQIAISTSGAAPTVAKKIRREIEQQYGVEWADYVSLLGDVRSLVLERVAGGEAEHKPIFSALAQSNLYDRVSTGEKIDPEDVYDELVAPMIQGRC